MNSILRNKLLYLLYTSIIKNVLSIRKKKEIVISKAKSCETFQI